jgi:hypothetical protein
MPAKKKMTEKDSPKKTLAKKKLTRSKSSGAIKNLKQKGSTSPQKRPSPKTKLKLPNTKVVTPEAVKTKVVTPEAVRTKVVTTKAVKAKGVTTKAVRAKVLTTKAVRSKVLTTNASQREPFTTVLEPNSFLVPKIAQGKTELHKKPNIYVLNVDDNESIYLQGHCTKCTLENELADPDTLKFRKNLEKELKQDRVSIDGIELTHAAAEHTLNILLKNVTLSSCVHFLVQDVKHKTLVIEKTPYNLLCVINYVNQFLENNQPIVSPFKNNRLVYGFEIDIATPCKILGKAHTRASLIELLKKKTKLSLTKLEEMRKADLCQLATETSLLSIVDKYQNEYTEIINAKDMQSLDQKQKQKDFLYKIYRIAEAFGIPTQGNETFTQNHYGIHGTKTKETINASSTNKAKGGANTLTENVLLALKKDLTKWSFEKKLGVTAFVVSVVALTAIALHIGLNKNNHQTQNLLNQNQREQQQQQPRQQPLSLDEVKKAISSGKSAQELNLNQNASKYYNYLIRLLERVKNLKASADERDLASPEHFNRLQEMLVKIQNEEK